MDRKYNVFIKVKVVRLIIHHANFRYFACFCTNFWLFPFINSSFYSLRQGNVEYLKSRKYNVIWYLRKFILRKQDTKIFDKVLIYKKMLNESHFLIHNFNTAIIYKKLAPLKYEMSCIRNWLRLYKVIS